MKINDIYLYSINHFKYQILYIGESRVFLKNLQDDYEFAYSIKDFEKYFIKYGEPKYGYINYRVYEDASGVKRLLTCGTNHHNIVGYNHKIKINLETGEVVS